MSYYLFWYLSICPFLSFAIIWYNIRSRPACVSYTMKDFIYDGLLGFIPILNIVATAESLFHPVYDFVNWFLELELVKSRQEIEMNKIKKLKKQRKENEA